MRERRFAIKSSFALCQPISSKKPCIDIVRWLQESFKGAKWEINMRTLLISGELYQLSREPRLSSKLKLRSKLQDSHSSKQKKKSRISWSFTCKLHQKSLTLFWKILLKINSMINSGPLRKKLMNYLAGIQPLPLIPHPLMITQWKYNQNQSRLSLLTKSFWRHATLEFETEWLSKNWVWLI